MNNIKPILASICAVAVVILGYDDYRLRQTASQQALAGDAATKQKQQVSVLEARNREMQSQLVVVQARADNLEKYVEQANPAATGYNPNGSVNATTVNTVPAYAPTVKAVDGGPVPASQIMAVRPITPLSPEELAQRVENAYQRTSEPLTAVTQSDLANMSDNFEWGTGDARRMWHMADANTYQEVYPDGSYSVFSILGRATVNGVPGVIAAKDDGVLDAFIPDKGSDHLTLSLRGTDAQAQWVDYRPMQNSQ